MWSCSRGFPRCATESCPEADCLELPLWTADPALSHYAVLVWVRSLPTCPPDCDSPIHTVIGRDHGVGHAVCRAEEQSQDGNDRSTMVGMICTIVGIFALFCLSHGCDPSQGRLGGICGVSSRGAVSKMNDRSTKAGDSSTVGLTSVDIQKVTKITMKVRLSG